MPPLARRAVLALAVLVACGTSDPFDSATNNTAVSVGGPGGGPGGGSNNMTEGTDPTDGTTTTDATTTPAPTTTGEPGTTTTGATLSHAVDIQPIWDANCVTACHTPGGTGATWFVLSGGAAYDSLVDRTSISFPGLTLVAPGDLDSSYLWHKVNGTQFEVGGGGSRMPPPPAASLSESDLETIRQWILEGCPP